MTYDMSPSAFVTMLIRPALAILGLEGPASEQLLLGTALQESGLQNIQQRGGPALGFFQMEPATHDSLHANFLAYKPLLLVKVVSFLPKGEVPRAADLILFPKYACAMARVKYLDCPGSIPTPLEDQAAYYKQWYNTPGGAATEQGYLNNWAEALQADTELQNVWN